MCNPYRTQGAYWHERKTWANWLVDLYSLWMKCLDRYLSIYLYRCDLHSLGTEYLSIKCRSTVQWVWSCREGEERKSPLHPFQTRLLHVRRTRFCTWGPCDPHCTSPVHRCRQWWDDSTLYLVFYENQGYSVCASWHHVPWSVERTILWRSYNWSEQWIPVYLCRQQPDTKCSMASKHKFTQYHWGGLSQWCWSL